MQQRRYDDLRGKHEELGEKNCCSSTSSTSNLGCSHTGLKSGLHRDSVYFLTELHYGDFQNKAYS